MIVETLADGRVRVTHGETEETYKDTAEGLARARRLRAEVRGLADEDADDIAIAAGATPIGRVYRVETHAQATDVRAVLRAGDVVVRRNGDGVDVLTLITAQKAR